MSTPHRTLVALLATAASTLAAMGQSFNIDINVIGPADGGPSADFGAAADQPGYWMTITQPPGGSYYLMGLDGHSTLARVETNATGTPQAFTSNQGWWYGNFAKLMKDAYRVDPEVDPDVAWLIYRFVGLEPGAYFFFTYADNGNNDFTETAVRVNGELQLVGGGLLGSNAFGLGLTHARHLVRVAEGEAVTAVISTYYNESASAQGLICGFQIQRLPTRLYVDRDATGAGTGLTWADAFTNMADLDAAMVAYAGAIDEVWVAEGTYTPTEYDLYHRGDSIVMRGDAAYYGGFAGTETELSQRDPNAHVTHLSGNIGTPWSNDNSYHVLKVGGDWYMGGGAVIDGFRISGGNADAAGSNIGDDQGGAIYVRDSWVEVRNCFITSNHAVSGGAVYARNSTVKLINCTFYNNGCDTSGGAVLSDWQEPSQLTISHCRFLGNDADVAGGAVAFRNGNLTITNSLLSGNTADYGGALYVSAPDAPVQIRNCTLVGNTAVEEGGAIKLVGPMNATLANSIVWANTAPPANTPQSQIKAAGGTYAWSYSCIQFHTAAAFPGSGNTGANPLFVDANGANNVFGDLDDDCRLASGSPLIDHGHFSGIGLDAGDIDGDGNTFEFVMIDLAGNPRRLDDPASPDGAGQSAPVVDMGCFEFVPACVQPGDADHDGDVDQDDLDLVLFNFGGSVPAGTNGDLDGNGNVSQDDLDIVLFYFGAACP